jgi:hypothetical protein
MYDFFLIYNKYKYSQFPDVSVCKVFYTWLEYEFYVPFWR